MQIARLKCNPPRSLGRYDTPSIGAGGVHKGATIVYRIGAHTSVFLPDETLRVLSLRYSARNTSECVTCRQGLADKQTP